MSETPKDGDEVVDPKTTLPPDYNKLMKDVVAGDDDKEKEKGPKERPHPVREKKDTVVPTSEYLAEFTRKFVADSVKRATQEKVTKEAKKKEKIIIPLAELKKQIGEEGGDK